MIYITQKGLAANDAFSDLTSAGKTRSVNKLT